MATSDYDVECNRQLDRVIEARRTVRSFTDEVPDRELIESIINAGLAAPYAAVAIGVEPRFRRFFVMLRGGEAAVKTAEIMKRNTQAAWQNIQANLPEGMEPPPFAKRLKAIAEGGDFGFEKVPYFIVVAELKGMPPVEQESLAHVLQNMWLKAAALGLGFRLISATSRLANDPDFCGMLGLVPGRFGINGCAIGYAAETPAATPRPPLDEATTWLD